MTALVCFATPDGQRCALDVHDAGAVVRFATLEPLPAPRAGVLGLLRSGEELLPVLGAAGARGRHVVVVHATAGRFGLLVDEVTAVVRVREEQLGPPPRGQERPVVRAIAGGAGAGALVLDPDVLGEGLA